MAHDFPLKTNIIAKIISGLEGKQGNDEEAVEILQFTVLDLDFLDLVKINLCPTEAVHRMYTDFFISSKADLILYRKGGNLLQLCRSEELALIMQIRHNYL